MPPAEESQSLLSVPWGQVCHSLQGARRVYIHPPGGPWGGSHFAHKISNVESIFPLKCSIFWALPDSAWKDVLEEMPVLFQNFKLNYKLSSLKSVLRFLSNSNWVHYCEKPGKICRQESVPLSAVQPAPLPSLLLSSAALSPPGFTHWPALARLQQCDQVSLSLKEAIPTLGDHPAPQALTVGELGCLYFNAHCGYFAPFGATNGLSHSWELFISKYRFILDT